MRIFRPLALILAMAVPLGAQAVSAGELVVTGTATVEAAPDMAMITLGVETQARTAAAAMADNNAAMSGLIGVLADAGIAARDTQTQGLMLDPQYSRQTSTGTSQINGYIARNQVQVRVRDLGLLGGVLDAAIRAGGNQFYGLSFDIQEKQPLADQALAEAVRDATRQASIMADAAGVTLGSITAIQQSGSVPRPVAMMREMAMASDAVPVAEGSVGLSASVTVTYEIGAD